MKARIINSKTMREKIIDTYYEYRQKIIERYEDPKHLKVVIIMRPESMQELIKEERFVDFGPEVYYTSMIGKKTPIVIRTDLPEDVEFAIQSQAEYEKQEKMKLLDKFYDMFGD